MSNIEEFVFYVANPWETPTKNIVIDEKLRIKLIDFGSASILDPAKPYLDRFQVGFIFWKTKGRVTHGRVYV